MLRITGGEFRGRLIQTPSGEKTRPTQARLRQAWFNSLQTKISNTRVLDLFSGSGALGFEALSWGADHVTFVEQSKSTSLLILKNAQALGVQDRIEIITGTLENFAKKTLAQPPVRPPVRPYDLVFADPPYDENYELELINDMPWGQWLTLGGWFFLEWGTLKSRTKSLPDSTAFLVKIREKVYGDSVLSTFERTAN